MASLQSTVRRAVPAASTGGAGTYFEQHLGTAFLSLLLVRGFSPILRGCTVSEVQFQTNRLGWQTDDILVVGESGDGTKRKLLVQAKRKFTISSSNDECVKAIVDAWTDFRNTKLFSPDNDRIAIATLRGTNVFLEHFVNLLDCARASQDSTDFEDRLGTAGFVNKKTIDYRNEIHEIISKHEGNDVPGADLWRFLCVLHGISFDLNTSTAQSESQFKSLLAHATQIGDPLLAADTSWNELLEEVGKGMPDGKSYTREDLPQTVRDRHAPIAVQSHQAIISLEDHGRVILDGIRTTVGDDCNLKRPVIVQQLLNEMLQSQLVIVTGPAGTGKSGIAKLAMDQLTADNFVFCFRAEEFAKAHLDDTLQYSRNNINSGNLTALLAGQKQKIILIESIERLLEASTRDAFTDLLTLAKRDPTWRLVLTCRDYSTDLVRAAFLEPACISHSVVEVQPLDDSELAEVEVALPVLATPLANPMLRKLLRSPYILDMASRLEWQEGQDMPHNERSFREVFWKRIIKREDRTSDGMPQRRNDAFIQVALRRARQLTLYAECANIDPASLESLHQDSLLVSNDNNAALVAPAHDVLEDWAILRWIDEQYAFLEYSLLSLSGVLGTEPAIRRCYRKWVGELVDKNAEAADAVYEAAISHETLPAYFRDDTLVALLKSTAAENFLERHTTSLFANQRKLLRRIIHLLRVGCVITPPYFAGTDGFASSMHVPDGDAWACLLKLIVSRLGDMGTDDIPLLLALAEDASRGVSWQTPYPEGSDSVIKIAYWLLPQFSDYRAEENRKRVLDLIEKLPKCEAERTEELLSKSKDQDRNCEDFRKLVLSGMKGMAVCRDFPDAVLAALREEMLLTEGALLDRRRDFYSMHTEPHFGINERQGHGYFPASAYHGPFLFLFRYHFASAIDFLHEVFNHSAEWHATQRVPMEYIEEPFEIELEFLDGTQVKQWCSARLWCWYRGTSVGPYALQSMLMAFEHWLLDFGEAYPDELDSLLTNVLRRSHSGAITAVVASVATAYPKIAAETLLVILKTPDCFLLDKGRLVQEISVTATMGFLSSLDPTKKIYDQERRNAGKLEHRTHDLETAIANLQLTPTGKHVHDLIDKHRASMPAVDEQTEADRVWRLALHRMDLRQYEISDQQDGNALADTDESESNGQQRQMIRLDLGTVDPDMQEMVDDSAKQHTVTDAQIGQFMWGYKVFTGEEQERYDPSRWKSMLQAVMVLKVNNADDGIELGRSAPEFIASVCIRDHFDELSNEQLGWCVNTVCNSIEVEANNWDQLVRIQNGEMDGNRPSAFVLSFLAGKPLEGSMTENVANALATAITHPIDEVRTYASVGAGRYLWQSAPDLAVRCVNVLAMEALHIQRLNSTRPFDERLEYGYIEFKVGMGVRQQFYGSIEENAYEQLDVSDWTGSAANYRILSILSHAPEQQLAQNAFARLAQVMVDWWDSSNDHTQEQNQSIDNQSALETIFEGFLLKISTEQVPKILKPILDAIERHPRFTSNILLGIVGIEDRVQQTERFWAIWQLFADKVREADWLSSLETKYSQGREMLAAIFLTKYWKNNINDWQSLAGYSDCIYHLFEDLPPSSLVLDNFVRFLYYIGAKSLPNAFIRIANRLRAGDATSMLQQSNTVFMIESLLRQHVYGRTRALKQNRELREAVLFLLDTLIEAASSSAYRMRDDFVTPVDSQ